MVTLADLLDENRSRFDQLIKRSLQVARQQIAKEGEDAPISDEARLRALNALSYAFQQSTVWDETRDLLLTLATKMEMAGYREDWLRYLEAGLAQSQVAGDRLAEAALRLHCGHLHRLMSHYAEAQALLQASATIYTDLEGKAGEARALNQLAYLAWQQHKPDEVATLAHQAMALLDEHDLERAMSLSALGLAAIEQHRWRDAEGYHRAALQIRTDHGNRRQQAWSLQNLGYALRGQGQFEVAIACYEEAIATLSELGDSANCAIAQMNLGIVYSLKGEPAKALSVYSVAESTFRHISNQWYLAKTLINQGIDHITLGNWQQAEQVFTASMSLFQRLSDLSEYLNALDGLGMSYLKQGAYDKALIIFQSVVAQLPEIAGTHYHQTLTKIIGSQLEQATVGAKGA